MKLISILFITLMIGGCVTKVEPIIRTEYVFVEVPVVYPIVKPIRPKFDESRLTTPEYVSDVLKYIKTLEVIIDEHNSTREKK